MHDFPLICWAIGPVKAATNPRRGYHLNISVNCTRCNESGRSAPTVPIRTLIVDLSVSVEVDLSYHVLDLAMTQIIAQVLHHLLQLVGRDGPASVVVDQMERLAYLVLERRRSPRLHDDGKLVQIDEPVSCRIILQYYLLVEGRNEGTCVLVNTVIYNNYLFNTKKSQETIAKAKQSR